MLKLNKSNVEIRKIILFIASILGLLDSFYLTDRHYNANGVCSTDVKEFLGYPVDCGYIDSSKYSEILSIPIGIIGLLYYLTIFLVLYFDINIDKIVKEKNISNFISTHLDVILVLSSIGFLFTLYLIYVQLVILEVVCIYCMYSAATTTVIFGTSISYNFDKT